MLLGRIEILADLESLATFKGNSKTHSQALPLKGTCEAWYAHLDIRRALSLRHIV